MQYSKYGYLFQIYNKIPTVDCNIFTVQKYENADTFCFETAPATGIKTIMG